MQFSLITHTASAFAFFPARPIVLAAVASLALGLGCSRQAEGERCDTRNGNQDCASGLTCVPASKLESIEVGGVCCRTDAERGSDVCLGSAGLEDGGTLGETPNTSEPSVGDSGANSPGAADAAGPTSDTTDEPSDAATGNTIGTDASSSQELDASTSDAGE